MKANIIMILSQYSRKFADICTISRITYEDYPGILYNHRYIHQYIREYHIIEYNIEGIRRYTIDKLYENYHYFSKRIGYQYYREYVIIAIIINNVCINIAYNLNNKTCNIFYMMNDKKYNDRETLYDEDIVDLVLSRVKKFDFDIDFDITNMANS